MNISVQYSEDLDNIPDCIPHVPEYVWMHKIKLYPNLPRHIKLIIYQIVSEHTRFDYIIQRTINGWEQSCVVSNEDEYCVYDWDTKVIQRSPRFVM